MKNLKYYNIKKEREAAAKAEEKRISEENVIQLMKLTKIDNNEMPKKKILKYADSVLEYPNNKYILGNGCLYATDTKRVVRIANHTDKDITTTGGVVFDNLMDDAALQYYKAYDLPQDMKEKIKAIQDKRTDRIVCRLYENTPAFNAGWVCKAAEALNAKKIFFTNKRKGAPIRLYENDDYNAINAVIILPIKTLHNGIGYFKAD